MVPSGTTPNRPQRPLRPDGQQHHFLVTMSSFVRDPSHLSRYLATLRQQRGLRPAQLAARLGATNVSKVGSLIRSFELGEPLSDHWLQKLIGELQPDPAELRRCVELDQAEDERRIEEARLAWEDWANEPIDPFLSVRFMPGVGRTIPVPTCYLESREDAEAWAGAEMKRLRGLKGILTWSRRERTLYDPDLPMPRRSSLMFEADNPQPGCS